MKTDTHFSSSLTLLFLEWEMFRTQIVQKIAAHVLCSVTDLQNRAFYGIMWKKYCRTVQNTKIWRMHIVCWIPKATNTHSEYVISISFPLQQLLHERAYLLRFTYIAYLVYNLSYSAVHKSDHTAPPGNMISV